MTDKESGNGTISPTLQTLARRAEPVVIETEGFGSVGFGQIKREVSAELPDLLAIEDDREFAIQLIHRLIVSPQIALEEWQEISDADLNRVIGGLATHHREIRQHFSQDEACGSLPSFRTAILRYSQYRKEQLERIIGVASIAQSFVKDISTSINPVLAEAAAISALSSAWSNQSQGIAGAAALLNRQIALDLDPMRMALASIQPSTTEFQTSLIGAFQGITTAWQSIQPDLFTRIQSSFLNLNFDLESSNTSISETNEILKKYQWFISPSMPATFVRCIKEIEYGSRSHRQSKMNRLFIQYITNRNFKNLRTMFADWKKNPLFAHRMAIIRSSLDVLRTARASHNPSNVVIPALVAQIDGIMCDFIEDRGIELRKGYFYNANGDKKKAEHFLRNLVEASTSAYETDDEFGQRLVDSFAPDNYFFFEVLFQGSRRGEALGNDTTFSRHKIMHGEYTGYGRMENTVKAYLVLDYLAYLDTDIPKVTNSANQ